MSKCHVCDKGPAPEHGGVTVYRQNKPGEMPAVWACREHAVQPAEPDVQSIVDILENGATN